MSVRFLLMFMTSKGRIPSPRSPPSHIANTGAMSLESRDEEQSIPEHVIQEVYRTTWTDFYDWEQYHVAETLHSLARPIEPPNTTQIILLPTPDSSQKGESKQGDWDEGGYFAVLDYDYDANPNGTEPRVTTSTLTPQTLEVTNVLDPYPAYEVCTPVNRNILVGDDSEYLPFLPFSDDPTFDHLAHIVDSEYRYFEWQVPNRDPDCDWLFLDFLFFAVEINDVFFSWF